MKEIAIQRTFTTHYVVSSRVPRIPSGRLALTIRRY